VSLWRYPGLHADVEDARLCIPPQSSRLRRQSSDEADKPADFLIGVEVPRIGEFKARIVAAAPLPLVQDQHTITQRVDQARQALSGKYLQVDGDEMRTLGCDPKSLSYFSQFH
jgi:hypothetical protein